MQNPVTYIPCCNIFRLKSTLVITIFSVSNIKCDLKFCDKLICYKQISIRTNKNPQSQIYIIEIYSIMIYLILNYFLKTIIFNYIKLEYFL